MKQTLLAVVAFCALLILTGCQTLQDEGDFSTDRVAMMAAIHSEPPGNYYIGRRFYKLDYKFWGYVRKPGEPWTSAKLVMLNEQKHLAPDREGGQLGKDNGYEYKLLGSFSGDTVYEPASNGFYPEFVLTGYELRSIDPPIIFKRSSAPFDPARRIIASPY